MSALQVCEPVNIVNCRITDVLKFTQAINEIENRRGGNAVLLITESYMAV